MRDSIGLKALKNVAVLYKGDIYDLSCLLLKISEAKDKGTNTKSMYTIKGLATTYALITHIPREEILEVFENHHLPLGAVIACDEA